MALRQKVLVLSLLLIAMIIAVVIVGIISFDHDGVTDLKTGMAAAVDSEEKATLLPTAMTSYICPMHPHILSEHEGSCPICGMDLVAQKKLELQQSSPNKKTASDSLFSTSTEPSKQAFVCPMHPHIMSEQEGSCPICGMDLVKQKQKAATERESRTTRSEVTIAPETIQKMGVRTQAVKESVFGLEVRSFGLVTENKRKTIEVSSRVSGWVESLAITAIGDEVKRGDLLFTLYSPDLISAQQDYFSALQSGINGRIISSKKRLYSLGVSRRTLKQITDTRKTIDQVPYYSQGSGIVSQLTISVGSYVTPGMMIAHLQDYSSVWIVVSVAEKDLQFLSPDLKPTVSKGVKASVTFPNLGELRRQARVDYIYPTIDAATRTGRVRLVLNNKDGKLKPGSYADIVFETKGANRLSIPSEALLQSSKSSYVVKALGDGRFRPVPLQTGVEYQGQVEVLQGITLGETIVVSGQFLIDSESSLREAFRKMQAPEALDDRDHVDDHESDGVTDGMKGHQHEH